MIESSKDMNLHFLDDDVVTTDLSATLTVIAHS